MVTMLDCIYRVPAKIESIVANRKETFAALLMAMSKKPDEYDELVFVGSGTSNTSSVTANRFVEKASGLSARTMLPNDFLNKVSYNKKALYIFVSQSGTSHLTQLAMKKVQDLGCLTVAITEHSQTPLSLDADIHVEMGCGFEEYGMRTIGYCATVLTEMLMGMEIGLARGALSQEAYDEYMKDALKVPESHKKICEDTLKWFDKVKESIAEAESIILYGSQSLWGVALEGALKILETARRYLCVGYELDDGLHGPDLAYSHRFAVLILNDGEKDDALATNAAKFAKAETGHGFVIGKHTLDDMDLPFDPVGNDFKCLEFAPVVEILAYQLGLENGVNIVPLKDMEIKSAKYFTTHDE